MLALRLRDAEVLVRLLHLRRDLVPAVVAARRRRRVQHQLVEVEAIALAGSAPICVQAMDVFVSILGAETGNCALRYMTTGGIFIAGVIAAKNVEKLKNAAFLQAFLDKGRMSSLLKDMPIRVILNDDCGLIGSARYTLVQKAFGNKSASA